MPAKGTVLEIGKGRMVREGKQVALLSFGTRLKEVQLAAEDLEKHGISATIADARFAKPLDMELIRKLVASHQVLITIEEGSVGGFGSFVQQALFEEGAFDRGTLKFRSMVMPDHFYEHDKPEKLYVNAGLDAKGHRQEGARHAGAGRGRRAGAQGERVAGWPRPEAAATPRRRRARGRRFKR